VRHAFKGLRGWFGLLLWFQAIAAAAHLSGFTDTSIQVANTGVKIIYTLPADNLRELDQQRARNSIAPRAPEAYLDAVAEGWQVLAKRRPCFLREHTATALPTIEAYQYVLRYECPQGFEELLIRYTLFAEQWRGEQNFTRVFMAGEQLRMRFSFDRKELPLAVPDLLARWGKPLQQDFFAVDPNRALRKESWIGFAAGATLPAVPWWQSIARADPGFIGLGMKHILEGIDHIFFVVGLLLIPAGAARLAGLVTAFTIAHSITLSLAVLQVIALPPAVTEPLIALTVAAIGAENLWRTRWFAGRERVAQIRERRSWRWLVTFGFGLFHGVGLSYALTEMGLADDIVGALLFFNIGVEFGQLLVVALCLPLTVWLFRQRFGLRASSVASAALTLLGLYWFAERIVA
jgi:hypothetical protein